MNCFLPGQRLSRPFHLLPLNLSLPGNIPGKLKVQPLRQETLAQREARGEAVSQSPIKLCVRVSHLGSDEPMNKEAGAQRLSAPFNLSSMVQIARKVHAPLHSKPSHLWEWQKEQTFSETMWGENTHSKPITHFNLIQEIILALIIPLSITFDNINNSYC